MVAYMLFALPDQLIKSVEALNNNNIGQTATALNPIYFWVGLVLTLGLGIIAINLLTKRGEVKKLDADLQLDLADETEEEETIEEEKLADESKEMVSQVKEISKIKGDQKTKFDQILAHVCKSVDASQGVIYLKNRKSNKNFLELYAAYAFAIAESETLTYEMGEGIIGQAAKEGKSFIVDSVPEGHMEIFSGLGNSSPTHLFIVPLKKDNHLFGVAELSSFKAFNSINQQIIQDSLNVLGTIIEEKKPIKKETEKPIKKAAVKKPTRKKEDN